MASPASTTTTATTAPSSMRVRDLLINDPQAPASPDDGFYSAAMFDTVDEEAFIRAQRNAFAEINDAALARAIQESEILAAQKAAEDTRRSSRIAASSSSSASRSTTTSSASASAPSSASPYALVPTNQLNVSSSATKRASDASASYQSVSALPTSSSPPSRSGPTHVKYTQSRSQYYTSSTTPSSLSLSASTSTSPQSRISTMAPATASSDHTHRPVTTDRQQSYYSRQNFHQPQQYQQHQSKPTMASLTHSRRASSTSVPTTSANGTSSASHHHQHYRQAAPTPVPSRNDTPTPYVYSSNISSTSASSKASATTSSSISTSASDSRPSTSRTTSAPNANAKAAPQSTSSSSSIPIPSAASRPRSSTASFTASTTPTFTSSSARDLRMGVLATMASRSHESKSNVPKPATRQSAHPRPQEKANKRGRRTRPVEADPRLLRARKLLRSNVGMKCNDCGSRVEGPNGLANIPSEPFSHSLLQHLHDVCSNSKCGASYCRGCFSSAKPLCKASSSSSKSPSSSRASSASPSRSASPANTRGEARPGCRGARGCNIRSCCPTAAVVAISTILDAFDSECIRAATHISNGLASPAASLRAVYAFVQVVISRSDAQNSRGFETVIIRTLHSISSWLAVFQDRCEDLASKEEEDDGDEDDDEDDDGEEDEENEEDSAEEAKDALHALIRHSLLLPFVHTFLQNRDVGDWLKHSEIYVLILEVLRRLVDNGLTKVLDEQMVLAGAYGQDNEGEVEENIVDGGFRWRRQTRRGADASPSESSTSSEAEDSYSSESDGEETETDATSPEASDSCDSGDDTTAHKRRAWAASQRKHLALRSNEERVPTIKALVTKLEEHRGPLMAFGATVKFAASKSKVNALCDGISYLLLQQVVGWD